MFKFRYVILLLFTIWTSIAAWRTSKLSPITEPETFLPEENMTEKAEKSLRNDFHYSGNSDNVIKVYFTWGVKGIN